MKNRVKEIHELTVFSGCDSLWSIVFAASLIVSASASAQPPPDADITANAVLLDAQKYTDDQLGFGQGVSLHNGKIYAYGDDYFGEPRVGIVTEHVLQKPTVTDGNKEAPLLKPTGRKIVLSKQGKPLLLHPTGLAWHEPYGCFLGDTVNKIAHIYHLDWDKALASGNLDEAVLKRIRDDAAVNGCRPEFVTLGDRTLLATADYGNVTPQIRLYDVDKMLAAGRTSAAGVLVHRIKAGPYNQNLHWNAAQGYLVCIQNAIEGRGWQLDVIDLANAVRAGDVEADGVRVRKLTFMPHDELEGYRPLPGGLSLFNISSPKNNLIIGRVQQVEPFLSRKGTVALEKVTHKREPEPANPENDY